MVGCVISLILRVWVAVTAGEDVEVQTVVKRRGLIWGTFVFRELASAKQSTLPVLCNMQVLLRGM